jgi:hypothetical protein
VTVGLFAGFATNQELACRRCQVAADNSRETQRLLFGANSPCLVVDKGQFIRVEGASIVMKSFEFKAPIMRLIKN